MPAPASDIDICNLSLDELGQAATVASINPPSTSLEGIMARHYDLCRQETLRLNPWAFATSAAMCTRIGTPLADYSDQYQLPSDFIRLLSVSPQQPNSTALPTPGLTSTLWQTSDYRILGKTVCINNPIPGTTTSTPGQPTILIRYTRDEADINLWDASAKKVLVLILAHDVAYKITKQQEVVDILAKRIAAVLPEALAVDGQENPPKRIEYSRAISRRRAQLGASTVAPPWIYLP